MDFLISCVFLARRPYDLQLNRYFFEFRRRLSNDTVTEFANDLQNVYIITRLRLNKLLDAS